MRKTNRIICFILAMILSFIVIYIPSSAAMTGDVNGDSKVTVSDALQIYNHLIGKTTLSGDTLKRADVNGDGTVTVSDAMKVYNIVLGKILSGTFSVTTYGYGHDIGLSQVGAKAYANEKGYTYKQILSHYFPGTTLSKDTNAPKKVKYNSVEYSMRDYIAGTLYAEMGPSFPKEALKAQCVVIYTYGKYNSNFGINFTINNHALNKNVATATSSNVIYDIVDEVMGEYLTYNGATALTPYFAISAGKTAACDVVWMQKIPYLGGVESPYDKSATGWKKTTTFTVDEMKYKLENNFDIELSDNPENWIKILSHDSAVDSKTGHAIKVSVDGQKEVKGSRIYEVLGLRSPCYTVEYSY